MKVNHDFHIHTYLSLCAPDKTGTVENFIKSAKRHGLSKLGFSNHFWGCTPGDTEYYSNVKSNPKGYYDIQNYEYISGIIPEIEKHSGEGVKLYFGAECEYDPFRKSIAVSRDQVESFDYLIVPNSHTHMMMPQNLYEPYEKHIDFMFDAFYDIISCEFSGYITAVAHPFWAVGAPYDRKILNRMISDDRYKKAFDAAANKGIGIEINVCGIVKSNPRDIDFMDEDIRMFRLAKECGCKFIFGSDAHSISEHENYGNCDKVADILKLTEDDIVEIAR